MEISYRRILKYPPVYNMMVMLMTSKDYDSLCRETKKVSDYIKSLFTNDKKLKIVGPADASIVKLNDIYRRVIYVKSDSPDKLRRIREAFEDYEQDAFNIMFDVNPVNTY